MEFDFEAHKKAENIDLAEFEVLCAELFKRRAEVEALQVMVDNANAALEELKTKVMTILEKTGKDKYPVTGFGTVFVQNRFNVSMPKDPDKKGAFLKFLELKGIKDDLITVHSQTLNSWYKQEMEAAVQEGNSDFKIPGLAEPTLMKTLAMRRV